MHTPRKPKLILLFLATAAFIAAAVLSLANDAASGQAVCFMRAAIPDHLPDAPAHAPVSSLLIHGVPAPYDAQTGVYYVPLSLKNGLANAKLSWKNAAESACLAADGAESDLAGAIADGHAFTLLISGRQGEYTQKVIFTALPMLVSKTLSDDTIKAAEDKASAKFTYFDPAGSDDGGYRILSGAGTKKLHGHYSRNYSKKSYRVSLETLVLEREGRLLPVRGARMDYLLNAMHMDTNKLRDKLALDLWEQFALDQPAANYKSGALSYVELVQDGRYWGLYGLMNPIDGHALGLTEDDTMIKSATSANISRADIASVRRTLDGGDLGLSVRWPDTYTGDALWEPMLAYYERFWENPDESSFETLYGMLDVPNAVDCTLFLLTVAAKDNDFSNTYYVFRKTGSDQWKLKCIPWDLNVTFGFENDRDQNVSNAFRMALATELDLSEAMENFMRKNPKAVFDLLQTRYLELRNRFLTPEFLMENLGVQSKSIMDSGALGREIARWRVVENTADTSGLAAFIRARFAFLDEYFGTPYSEAKLDPVH